MFSAPRALFKGAKAQMAQNQALHDDSMKLQREQMAQQAAISAAQLALANKPIPVPPKIQPGVTETSADVAQASEFAKRRLLKKTGNQTILAGDTGSKLGGFRQFKLGSAAPAPAMAA